MSDDLKRVENVRHCSSVYSWFTPQRCVNGSVF